MDRPYLLGDSLTVLDIAWLVYAHRLVLAGYPLARLHPRLNEWAKTLSENPAFKPEIALPPPLVEMVAARRRVLEETGSTLEAVCGL